MCVILSFLRRLPVICGAGIWLLAAGCASGPDVEQTQFYPAEMEPETLYEWNPDGLSGPARVVINLTRQRAHIFIGGQLAGWTMVATGREGFGTPAGQYTILEKVVNKYSTLFGRTVDAEGNVVRTDADIRKNPPPPGGAFEFAPMPYWMRLTNHGIGMHAGPIPRPGSPASHGCIRLPRDFAPELFDVVHVGTPVTIVR